MSDSTDKDLPDDLPDGQELDDYLRGGSAVSRQYRQLRSADVPAEIDRLVLRQAQQAVKARPAKSRAWMRWTGPLALAASAVLVISIVIESGVQEEAYVSAPASAPIEPQILRERAEQSLESKAVEAPAPDSDQAQDQAVANKAADAPVVHVVPVDPGTIPEAAYFEPAPIQSPAPVAAPAEAPAPSRDRAIARSVRPAAPPIPAPAPMPQSSPSARLDQPDLAATTTEKREADTINYSVEEAIVTAQKRRAIGDEEAARTIQGSLRGEQNRVAGPRNSVATPAGRLSDEAEQADEPRSYSDAEEWLRDIRELRKQDKHEDADREWRRFRSVFPNYAVAENDPARGATR